MVRTFYSWRRIGLPLVLAALAGTLAGPASAVSGTDAPSTATAEAVCPVAKPGTAECLALRRTDIAARPASAVLPLISPPSGLGPADIQGAYALPSDTAGAGMTVAVVDAFDLPTAEADLAAYRAQFGLPPCTTASGCFRKVDQNGGTSYPAADPGWGLEIALDIDMVSAACPKCNILLVEASSPSILDLGLGVDRAVTMGAIAVSNSYGGPEGPGETGLDAHYNHPGVAVTVATGDCGYNCAPGSGGTTNGVEYPSASQYVVAVGGTTLTKDSSTRGWTEKAWGHGGAGAGSGCSSFEPKPAWQHDSGCSKRTQADVSAVADPATGVAVYKGGTWGVFGGTSAAAPIIAGVYALAGRPATGTYPASYPYANTADLFDVVSGSSNVTGQTCDVVYLCTGVAGYDGPTGLGTPNGVSSFLAPRPTYFPLAPVRILDTRDGTGGIAGPLSSHVARTFQVAGAGGVPTDATAVTGNLTVTQQTSLGFLYVGPVAINNPTSSTLNFPKNDDRANAVTVALGPGGTLSVTYAAPKAGPTAHVVFDVTGYFSPDTAGATYHAMAPTRIMDSRDGTGGLSGKFTSHHARTFQVATAGGVPGNATAVTGNLTVTGQSYLGYLFVGPAALDNPTSSTLNFPQGDDRANAVAVQLGAGGTLSVTYAAPPTAGAATADVVFDVTGYFTPDKTGAVYFPLSPTRILDTRNGIGGLPGAFGSHVASAFPVIGGSGVPGNATAVTGNLTVTQQTSAGFLFIGPVAINFPTTSTLNFPKNDDRANAVTVELGGGGTLSITYAAPSYGPTAHVIFDVTGFFAP